MAAREISAYVKLDYVMASYAVGREKCWTGETIEAERFFPGWLFDKSEEWVQNIYKEMRGIGLNPTIANYDFCTNASHYAGEAGIRCVGVGPSLETLAHTINEYIEIDQLNKVMESYYGVMKALLTRCSCLIYTATP